MGAREPKNKAFPTTQRSAVLGLASGDPELRRTSWDRIARAYVEPVRGYVRLRWRLDAERTDDLVQALFARFLERDTLRTYDPSKARFRTFLRVCVDRHVIDALRAQKTQARASGEVDPDAVLIEGEPDAEALFDAQWTRHVSQLALDALRAFCAEHDKTEHLRVFERFHLHPDDDAPSYDAAGEELGMTAITVQNRLAYARRHFRRLVLEVLREATANEEEFRSEARTILGVDV
jgi:RNA polymerase sigma factor (sigma-70 family)